MPPSCCVIGCKSRRTLPPGVVFFQLPLNKPHLLTQWLIVLDRLDWLPKPSHRICSLHFCTEDYISNPKRGGRLALKPDAIPSIFPEVVKKAIAEPNPKGQKSNTLDLKNKVIALNSVKNVIYFSYADLNPVVDISKNNCLFKKESSSTENSTNDDSVVKNKNAVADKNHELNNYTLIRETATAAIDNNEGQVSAPLRTCISPILKISEKDVLGDNQPKELLQSKLKLGKEEMSYRSEVHKKLRLLKETIKRQNKTIRKLKQKVACLEKSVRDERKLTAKMIHEKIGPKN